MSVPVIVSDVQHQRPSRWAQLRLKMDAMWDIYLAARAGEQLDVARLPEPMLQQIYGYKDVARLHRDVLRGLEQASDTELKDFFGMATPLIGRCFQKVTAFQQQWISFSNMSVPPDIPPALHQKLARLGQLDALEDYRQLLAFFQWFQVGESYSNNREYLGAEDFALFRALDLNELMRITLSMASSYDTTQLRAAVLLLRQL